MFNLNEFDEVEKLNYGIMNVGDMVEHLLKEIVYYSCGCGWSTAANEVEEKHIWFHYTEKTHGLTSSGYITNLKIMLGAEINYLHRKAKIIKPIKGFDWNIDITDNEDVFVLILRKK